MNSAAPTKDDYHIGIITALPLERAAVTAMLDGRYDKPNDFRQTFHDPNSYTWGHIGSHNVVIASLSTGVYGTTIATATALPMLFSFPNIKFGLMVGIGAGVPNTRDIRLGDVVVSQPSGSSNGVFQYDLGKAKYNEWERKDSLARPPEVLLKALGNLQAEHEFGLYQAHDHFRDAVQRYEHWAMSYSYPSAQDKLFLSSYVHQRSLPSTDCVMCDSTMAVERRPRKSPDQFQIHYGVIASGNSLVKDAELRDKIAAMDDQCICIEMEAAGLMNNFPCLVIRGICDYADSHKNDTWQRYASATAAAFTKELLSFVPMMDFQKAVRATEFVQDQKGSLQKPLDRAEGVNREVQAEFRGAGSSVDAASQLEERGTPTNQSQPTTLDTPDEKTGLPPARSAMSPLRSVFPHAKFMQKQFSKSNPLSRSATSPLTPSKPASQSQKPIQISSPTSPDPLRSESMEFPASEIPSAASISTPFAPASHTRRAFPTQPNPQDSGYSSSSIPDNQGSQTKRRTSYKVPGHFGIDADSSDSDSEPENPLTHDSVNSLPEVEKLSLRDASQSPRERVIMPHKATVESDSDSDSDDPNPPTVTVNPPKQQPPQPILEPVPSTTNLTTGYKIPKVPDSDPDSDNSKPQVILPDQVPHTTADRSPKVSSLDSDHNTHSVTLKPEERLPHNKQGPSSHSDIQQTEEPNISNEATPSIEISKGALTKAIKAGDLSAVRTLLHHGADPNELSGREKETVLHVAAGRNNYKILELLLDNGANINAQTVHNATALHVAAHDGFLAAMKVLLERGADTEIQDTVGHTPLHSTVWREHLEAMKLLIDYKANIDTEDRDAWKPVHWVAKRGTPKAMKFLIDHNADIEAMDQTGLRPLHLAAAEGRMEMMQLLIDHKANIEATSKLKRTPLHEAAAAGHKRGVVLLDAGANLEARDSKERTPLLLAISCGMSGIARLLQDRGANIHVVDSEGDTPLHWAARKNDIGAAHRLINERADISAMNKKNRTPLAIAKKNKSKEIVKLLEFVREGLD